MVPPLVLVVEPEVVETLVVVADETEVVLLVVAEVRVLVTRVVVVALPGWHWE